MQIKILFPSGTQTVDLEELKTLVRQGVVQRSTILETGGERGKAKHVPALKPIFAELDAQSPQPPQPPQPPTFSSVPTPPDPPTVPSTPNAPNFADVLRGIVQKDAPQSPADVYELSRDAASTPPPTPEPPQTSPQIPIPPNAPNADSRANGAYYFDAKTPFPFVPKRFNSSKKGFYVDSLKALRCAELTRLVACGRDFVRVLDVLFIVAVVIYVLVFTFSAGATQYRRAKARQDAVRAELYRRLDDALGNLGLADEPFGDLEETPNAWIPLLLTEKTRIEKDVTASNFNYKSFNKQFEIVGIAEKQANELEKRLPKKLSQEQKELQSYLKEFRKDVKKARRLHADCQNVPFPIYRFLGGTFLGFLVAFLVGAVGAFLYGLATILFRLLFSAADLYAASFRDDFDPAANKRRDDLLASVETIKTNGAAVATATPKTNDFAE